MRLLITRPEPAASALAREITLCGHEAVLAPLFRIVDLPAILPDLTDFDGLILSSANGVAALARRTDMRDIPIFAVGPQTAARAHNAGFTDVHTGPGTGAELMKDLQKLSQTRCVRRVLHVTAQEGKQLSGKVLAITRAELYTSEPAPTLPPAAAAALSGGKLDGALFFSPRSARIFCKQVARAGLAESCAPLTAFCISASTAAALSGSWRAIKTAAHPHRAALLDLL